MKALRMVLALLVVVVCATAANAATSFSIKDDELIRIVDGKSGPVSMENLRMGEVDNSDLQYVAVGEEGSKDAGIKACLLLFDASGKLLGSLPFVEGDECVGVSLSPDKKIIAIATGGATSESWQFYSIAEFKPLFEEPLDLYAPAEKKAIYWFGNTAAFVHTFMEQSEKRQCDYDPCVSSSVELLDVKTGKTKPVFAGTELCDYVFESFADGIVTANSICTPSATDWKSEEQEKKQTVKTVTVKLQ